MYGRAGSRAKSTATGSVTESRAIEEKACLSAGLFTSACAGAAEADHFDRLTLDTEADRLCILMDALA